MGAHGSMERISLERARKVVVEHAAATAAEHVATESALGRVLAEPVFARLASPHYRASAMDGIAVRARDTGGAGAEQPVVLAAHDGESQPPPHACRVVDTGNPLPEWADAIVRIEHARRTTAGFEIRSPVAPGRDVRRIGEDVEAGALILGRGHVVRPADIGAMLATGVADVIVRRPPRIGVLATGTEVIEPLKSGAVPAPGQVIEFNSRVLVAYSAQWGAQVEYLGRGRDDEDHLAEQVLRALAAHDAVCVIAGSSAGRKDFSVRALARCGRVLFHGVDVMPGGPAAFASVDGRPVFVVPGYPVSAVVVYRELVRAWIDATLGRAPAVARTVKAQVRRKIASHLGVEELLRVCLAFDGTRLVVAPLPRGAGSISTMVRAHGMLRIGPLVEGFDAGSEVDIELLEPDFDASTALVAAGPPHPITAALADRLALTGTPVSISHLGLAAHDALAALAVGQAHLALVVGEEAALADRGVGSPVAHVVVETSAGAEAGKPACVLLSPALLSSDVGARVRAALGVPGHSPAR